jgi:hypothetical protein
MARESAIQARSASAVKRLPGGARVRYAAAGLLLVVAAVALATTPWQHRRPWPRTNDVLAWAAPGTKPLPDAAAAAQVTRDPENVRANGTANRYQPSDSQLRAFRTARNSNGQTEVQFNPLMRFVTGRPGIRNPSTDELVQWVARKWGIPTDWLRAQLVVESRWRQSQLGDPARVPAGWFSRYPELARLAPGRVYQSLGVAQVKWIPDGSVGAGTEPLRWRSTAFNLDFYAATVRYYYDGLCGWCTRGYGAGQAWNSIGAWYSPEPWSSPAARRYVEAVRRALADRAWTSL